MCASSSTTVLPASVMGNFLGICWRVRDEQLLSGPHIPGGTKAGISRPDPNGSCASHDTASDYSGRCAVPIAAVRPVAQNPAAFYVLRKTEDVRGRYFITEQLGKGQVRRVVEGLILLTGLAE